MMQIKEELLDIDGIKKSKKPLLDLFIRRTAVLTSTPENIVEKIVKDQWRNANKMFQMNSSVGEIDFCNLGTFFISQSKAKKRIRKIEKTQTNLINVVESTHDRINKRRELSKIKNIEVIRSIKLKTKQNVE